MLREGGDTGADHRPPTRRARWARSMQHTALAGRLLRMGAPTWPLSASLGANRAAFWAKGRED